MSLADGDLCFGFSGGQLRQACLAGESEGADLDVHDQVNRSVVENGWSDEALGVGGDIAFLYDGSARDVEAFVEEVIEGFLDLNLRFGSAGCDGSWVCKNGALSVFDEGVEADEEFPGEGSDSLVEGLARTGQGGEAVEGTGGEADAIIFTGSGVGVFLDGVSGGLEEAEVSLGIGPVESEHPVCLVGQFDGQHIDQDVGCARVDELEVVAKGIEDIGRTLEDNDVSRRIEGNVLCVLGRKGVDGLLDGHMAGSDGFGDEALLRRFCFDGGRRLCGLLGRRLGRRCGVFGRDGRADMLRSLGGD